MIARRILLGGGLAALATRAFAQGRAEIAMRGTAQGERIWFSPRGFAVPPGTIPRRSASLPVQHFQAAAQLQPHPRGELRRCRFLPVGAAHPAGTLFKILPVVLEWVMRLHYFELVA